MVLPGMRRGPKPKEWTNVSRSFEAFFARRSEPLQQPSDEPPDESPEPVSARQ